MAIALLIRVLDLFRLFDVGAAYTYPQGGPGTMTRDDFHLYLQPRFQAVRDQLHRSSGFDDRGFFECRLDVGLKACGVVSVNQSPWSYRLRQHLRLVVAIGITLVFLFPVYWLAMNSFKTADEIYASPPVWWPASLQFNDLLVPVQRW
jgi:hypothetical protein